MSEQPSIVDRKSRTGVNSAIGRLLAAIEYPDRAEDGSGAATLLVDGVKIRCEETGGRIVLSHVLAQDAGALRSLAECAAGRILKEDATLAWDGGGGGRSGGALLWQSAAADSDSHTLLRFFETFMNSCDWWRDRVDALSATRDEPEAGAAVIRP